MCVNIFVYMYKLYCILYMFERFYIHNIHIYILLYFEHIVDYLALDAFHTLPNWFLHSCRHVAHVYCRACILSRLFPCFLKVNVSEEPKSRWRPLPLNTVEMTKLAASKLHMSPQRCMQLAEELYQKGFISYPRTETDRLLPGITWNCVKKVTIYKAIFIAGSVCSM